MKRAYRVEVERRIGGQSYNKREYTVVASNAEDAIKRVRVAAKRDSGFSSPWFIKSLVEIGDAI